MLHIVILLAVYLIPATVLFHFATEIFFRNPRRSEFQLSSLALLSVMALFVEEFVRQALPVSNSASLVFYVFGNFGALSAAMVTHFFFKITHPATSISPRIYIPISYVLVVPSILTLFKHGNIYNSTQFFQSGPWIQPVYNVPYFVSITVGNIVLIGLSLLMYISSRKSTSPNSKKSFRVLSLATLILAGWHILFGIFPGVMPLFHALPPYPYIFGDLIWVSLLRWAMSSQALLPPYGKQYKTLFNLVPAAIIVADTKSRILEANPAAQELFGTNLRRLTELVPRTEREETSFIKLFISRTTTHQVETELLRHDKTIMSALVSIDFVDVDGRQLSIASISDITGRKQSEQRITHLAYFDSLTDLPNRAHFYQILSLMVDRSKESKQPFAVLLVDIDHFKEINDTFGHQTGDLAIQHVAAILKASLQAEDIAARLGGDEFVLMLRQTSTQNELLYRSHTLVHELNTQFFADGQTIRLSASIGVAFYPEDGNSPDDLIRAADIAMYEAKQHGRNQAFSRHELFLQTNLETAANQELVSG